MMLELFCHASNELFACIAIRLSPFAKIWQLVADQLGSVGFAHHYVRQPLQESVSS